MEKQKLILVTINQDSKPMPYFYAGEEKLSKDDRVVVENETGVFLGTVISGCEEKIQEKPSPIVRKATKKDEEKFKENNEKAQQALKTAKEKSKKYKFEIKLSSAQYTLDGSKLILTFTSEERVDFRDFVKELANIFKARIELKQIGSRDEVKVVGGLGVCGKMCCCKEFLPEFSKVSIKMAKNQNLSLNPQKINGLCGRLMCCLSFENEAYSEVMARMPKLNSEVETPDGKGKVVYNDVLNETVSVKFVLKDESVEVKDFPLASVKVKTYAIKD